MSTSVYVEKNTGSRSSTGEAGEEETRTAPMIILDNLGICEQRAKTMLETGAQAALPGMLDGRERHQLRLLKRVAMRAVNALKQKGFKILHRELEGPRLALTLATRSGKRLQLRGRPDIVLAAVTPRSQLAVINIEYTTYTTAPETVIYRHSLYAHTLYRLLGFPVVPALVVDTPSGAESYILVKRDESLVENRLRAMVSRLAELADGTPARPARSREACHTCPLSIRNTCPYWEG